MEFWNGGILGPKRNRILVLNGVILPTHHSNIPLFHCSFTVWFERCPKAPRFIWGFLYVYLNSNLRRG
jgi:hypothetical protein